MQSYSPNNGSETELLTESPSLLLDTEQNTLDTFPIHLQGQRVLICEDEYLNILPLRAIVRLWGLDLVGEARTGEEAVAMALAERPEIVLMDLQLPGIDGLEAARRILKGYPATILLVTGYASADTQREAMAVGVTGFLLKPVTIHSFGSVLRPTLH